MSTVSGAALFMGNSDLTGETNVRTPVSTLGQNDFLKLLVTKMSSQDPMNPQGDEEFIGQMAQFTALEQSKSMRNDIAALSANNMIGRTVSIKEEASATGYDPAVEGEVSAIRFNEGSPEIIVGNRSYAISRVTLISPFTQDAAAGAPLQMAPVQTPGVLPSLAPLQALSMIAAETAAS